MIPKPMEFKIFALVLGALFLAVLTMTRSNDKRRAQFFFILLMIHLVFQGFQFMEFYPVTAFQRFAVADEKAVKYVRLSARLEGGKELNVPPVEVLPVLRSGRYRHFSKTIFQNPAMADEFATSYNQEYEKRFRKSGMPAIWQLDFEKKKWDMARDPYDAERGFLVKKITGEPRTNA